MVSSEFRRAAWNKMSGQWGTMALATFVKSALEGLASSLMGIGLFIVGGPMQLAMSQMTLNIHRGKTEKIDSLFDTFKTNFGGSVLAYVLISLFTFLWSLLFFIPGIIKQYSYAMTYFIMADNPKMEANDARKRSMEIMKGNKWRLFCLDFSFIGWDILALFTFGILYYWITPYRLMAYAEFYRELVPDAEQAPKSDSAAGGKKCAKCGAQNDADAAFCIGCGAPMPVVAGESKAARPTVFCPNCGTKNDPDSAFCTSCGAKIQ